MMPNRQITRLRQISPDESAYGKRCRAMRAGKPAALRAWDRFGLR